MNAHPTPEQLHALQTLFDLGIDRASAMLNLLTTSPLHLQMSAIEILSRSQLDDKLAQQVGKDPIAAMELSFRGELEGIAQVVFPPNATAPLMTVIADEERQKLDRATVREKTLSEVGNTLFNGLMGSMSEVIEQGITYMAPSYKQGSLDRILASLPSHINATSIYGQTRFRLPKIQASGDIPIFFMVQEFDLLLANLTIH